MKSRKKIIILLTFILVLKCILIPTSANSSLDSCGDNASWSYDSLTGTLTISGTGAVDGYEKFTAINGKPGRTPAAPWKQYADNIRTIVIEEGITSIGESAFKQLGKLTDVKLF